jgi:hypothetical protein
VVAVVATEEYEGFILLPHGLDLTREEWVDGEVSYNAFFNNI